MSGYYFGDKIHGFVKVRVVSSNFVVRVSV